MLIFSPVNIASVRAFNPDFFRQLHQQLQRLVGHTVLRVVQKQSLCLNRQPRTARSVLGKQPRSCVP